MQLIELKSTIKNSLEDAIKVKNWVLIEEIDYNIWLVWSCDDERVLKEQRRIIKSYGIRE